MLIFVPILERIFDDVLADVEALPGSFFGKSDINNSFVFGMVSGRLFKMVFCPGKVDVPNPQQQNI